MNPQSPIFSESFEVTDRLRCELRLLNRPGTRLEKPRRTSQIDLIRHLILLADFKVLLGPCFESLKVSDGSAGPYDSSWVQWGSNPALDLEGRRSGSSKLQFAKAARSGIQRRACRIVGCSMAESDRTTVQNFLVGLVRPRSQLCSVFRLTPSLSQSVS